MRKAPAILAALAAATLLTVTGCGYEEGPTGRVVDKDKHYQSTKTWKYELTVRTVDGTEHEFRVSHRDYNACRRGSAYPTCTEAR